jgi:hypothetical protein
MGSDADEAAASTAARTSEALNEATWVVDCAAGMTPIPPQLAQIRIAVITKLVLINLPERLTSSFQTT